MERLVGLHPRVTFGREDVLEALDDLVDLVPEESGQLQKAERLEERDLLVAESVEACHRVHGAIMLRHFGSLPSRASNRRSAGVAVGRVLTMFSFRLARWCSALRRSRTWRGTTRACRSCVASRIPG